MRPCNFGVLFHLLFLEGYKKNIYLCHEIQNYLKT